MEGRGGGGVGGGGGGVGLIYLNWMVEYLD